MRDRGAAAGNRRPAGAGLMLGLVVVGMLVGLGVGLALAADQRPDSPWNALRQRLSAVPLAGPLLFAHRSEVAAVDAAAALEQLSWLELEVERRERAVTEREAQVAKDRAGVAQATEALRQAEVRLAEREADIEGRLAELALAEQAASHVEADVWLSRVVQGMKPAQAAAALQALDNEAVLAILIRLSHEDAARILADMDRQRVAELVTRLRTAGLDRE